MNDMDKYRKLIENSKITVLTGAGISTASGLPDFRSETGLYNLAPETILSREFFFDHPDVFYDFFEKYLYVPQAQPNDAHKILAKWEKLGVVNYVITQNIDGFHQGAGSEKVIEYHGTMATATCNNPKCRKQYTVEELLSRKSIKEKFWECDCGPSSTRRYIKPDIVLYNEAGKWMQGDHAKKVYDIVNEAELLLVLGTSLRVYPFSFFINYRNPNAKVLIINKGDTTYDNDPSILKIEEDIGTALKKIDPF